MKLKQLFNDLIENYRKYFSKTYGIALAYTTICFIAMALLLRFSNFDNSMVKRQVSLVSYIVARYSAKNIYSIVDLSKTVFLFFISLFSVSFYRLKARPEKESERWSIGTYISMMRVKDLVLVLTLLVCSGADYGLFRVQMLTDNIVNHNLQTWLYFILYLLRVFVPLFLFSLTQLYAVKGLPRLDFGRIMFLLLALWLVDQFAFEVIAYARKILFDLVLIPVEEVKHYYIESILAIPLLALFFLSYHVGMIAGEEP